jgi:hypothetical protein
MWELLFAISWHAPDDCLPQLLEILLDLVPRLLPCHTCRLGYRVHLPTVNRRAHGKPKNPAHAFRWLYYLKDEVNRSFTPPVISITLQQLYTRYAIHDGHVLNDVEVADLLVLVAIEAKSLGREKDYRRFCVLISDLLPVASDSILPSLVCAVMENVTTHALHVTNSVRAYRCLPIRTLKHFRDWGDA